MYDRPARRMPSSNSRDPAWTTWVWGSTKPGMTVLPEASMMTVASSTATRRRTASVSPTATMRPSRDGHGAVSHDADVLHLRPALGRRVAALDGDQLRRTMDE